MTPLKERLQRFCRRTVCDQRGQYMVWFLAMMPLTLALVGLVVDGGNMVRWHRQTQIAAHTAAQAAAHEVDVGRFAASNEIVLAPQAHQVAQAYASANSQGRVRVASVAVVGERVRVICRANLPTIFMRAVGIEHVTVSVAGYARPAFGLNREGE